MASTSTVRRWWRKSWKCNPPSTRMFGKRVRFAPELSDAVKAAEAALISSGYRNVKHVSTYYPKAISGYRCNMRRGGRGCSLHGYGVAFDLDAPENPNYRRKMTASLWRRIKLTPAQVRAVEAIRTMNGKQVWLWLGWAIGDTMHFQINCRPKDLATGIAGGVPHVVAVDDSEEDDLFCKHGDGMKGPGDKKVAFWQDMLNAIGAKAGKIDGKYGSGTVAAVKRAVPGSNGEQVGPVEAAAILRRAGSGGLSRGDKVRLV